jgi:hypothetical protein
MEYNINKKKTVIIRGFVAWTRIVYLDNELAI